MSHVRHSRHYLAIVFSDKNLDQTLIVNHNDNVRLELQTNLACSTQVYRAYIPQDWKACQLEPTLWGSSQCYQITTLISLNVDVAQVGSYGRINRNTDNFIVEGNIYDDEFKENLIRLGIDIANGEHRPEEYSDEVDFSAWSENMKKLEMNTETHA